MTQSVLDTDILSEVLKGKNRLVMRRAVEYRTEFGAIPTTVLTVFEIISGYHRVQRLDQLERFKLHLHQLAVISLTDSAAVIAGQIAGELARRGQTIGWSDPLIAAMALSRDLTLVTGNTGHYQRIVGLGYPLRLENWRQP